MEPGIRVLADDRHDPLQWVEGPTVHLARLRADDGRVIPAAKRLGERGTVHPSLVVGGDPLDPTATQPDEAQGVEERDVAVGSGDDPDLWGALQSLLLDVPTRRAQDGMITTSSQMPSISESRWLLRTTPASRS